MDGVLRGFAVVGVVLVVGYLVGRSRILGEKPTATLSTLSFTVGLPCLIFTVISGEHLSEVFSATGVIAVLSAVACMVVVVAVGVVRRWGVSRSVMSALATGIVNSTNLGVPLSTYLFGSVLPVTPIIVFQLAILTPIALTILDLADPVRRPSPARLVTVPFRNPVTIAAIAGVLVSALGIRVPDLVLAPLELMAQLTVPLMLLIFGMTLHEFASERSREGRGSVAFVSVMKSLVQPAIAFVLARYVFDLSMRDVYVAVSCAILPTGQNVVIYAIRYGVALPVVRGVAVVSSIAAVPLLLVAAALFAT